jgi:protein-tyrosine-phosphatase
MEKNKKIRVLCLCLGNICRSPMAQTILEDIARNKNLKIEVDSAGLHSLHRGELADPRTLKVLKDKGLSCDHRARPLDLVDLEEFDYILVAEKKMINTVKSFARNNSMTSHLPVIECYSHWTQQNRDKDLADPYYGDLEDFEQTYNDLRIYLEDFVSSL